MHYTTTAAAAADATTTTTASHNTTLHDVTVDYETLYHTIRHNNTRHYAALRYSITPQDDSNCNYSCEYTNYTTSQRQLHDTAATATNAITTTTALHHTTCSRQHNSKYHHLSGHQSVLRSAIRDSQQLTSPIGFLFFTLPRPPCAVMLENIVNISGNRSICNDMK